MPADSEVLRQLQNPTPIKWEDYKVPGESKWVRPPIPVGKDNKKIVFEGILPASFKYEAKDGNLVVIVDPIVLRGSNYQIRFHRISNKTWPSGDGSFLASFVKCVDKTVKPQTNQEYIATIDRLAKRPCKFTADWVAYDKQTNRDIATTYSDFPLDEQVKDGFTRKPLIELPDKRLVFANLKIKNFMAV